MLVHVPIAFYPVAQTRTLTALDPVTGARVTRRTARTYVAAVVWTAVDGSVHVHAWAGRPDLAAKQLAKLERLGIAGTPRLAPVVGDPWAEAPAAPEPVAEPAPAAVAEPVAAPVPATRAERALTVCQAALAAQELTRTLPRTRPTLPGEALPPEPPAWPAPEPTLPELRRDAAAGRPVSLAALARTLGRELGLPQGGRLPSRRPAAGEPWDPCTPEARARVALQGERVATLWPIAQAVRGAGLTLPGAWATDGPVLAGEWPEARALAVLPSDCLRAAAVALAALPPVTVAQERALTACRAARARAVV